MLPATCARCRQAFTVRDADLKFYENFSVPPPRFCPECRLQHRLQFRNERTLYKRQSTLSQKPIISIYHAANKYPVYAVDEWWSDNWDALEYGQDFDFNRPFFEQFQELLLKVPRIALFNVHPENSDYCQQAYNNKNCYLCSVVKDCEDSMYLTHTNNTKDSYDSSHTQNLQFCHECLDSDKLYECVECQGCQNSNNLIYCYDCIGCSSCLGSAGLRNKKYYIFNKPYSKEEYEKKLASLDLGSFINYQKYKQHFHTISQKAIHRADWNLNTFDCLGNYLIHAKNCFHCFDSFEIEDCSYCTWTFESQNCQDIYGMGTSSFVYQSVGVEKLNTSAFNTFVSDSNDVFYSDLCFYSHNLFGCASLRRKKHCILNKQYSPEAYANLRAKIIAHMQTTGEWGEFFPIGLSPFAYNESVAQEYFPITPETAHAQGFNWHEEDQKEYQKATMELPDHIREAQDEIADGLFACATCQKNYKIPPQELNFLQKMNVPLPRKCPLCRYMERFKMRNPRTLYDRECQKCGTAIKTTYAPERPEKIYCEKCYLATVE